MLSEDIPKVKGKKANFRKSCMSFKVFDRHLTCNGKRTVIFDNDRKLSIPLCFTVILNTHLQSLNCK